MFNNSEGKLKEKDEIISNLRIEMEKLNGSMEYSKEELEQELSKE